MDKAAYAEAIAAGFEDELKKIASSKMLSGKAGVLAPAAAGIAGYELLRRANQDRKIGRQVRMQQQY
jgi:hypothetical protein